MKCGLPSTGGRRPPPPPPAWQRVTPRAIPEQPMSAYVGPPRPGPGSDQGPPGACTPPPHAGVDADTRTPAAQLPGRVLARPGSPGPYQPGWGPAQQRAQTPVTSPRQGGAPAHPNGKQKPRRPGYRWHPPCAWKPEIGPRQKGHAGAARPRAHSWYAHERHSACAQPPTAT